MKKELEYIESHYGTQASAATALGLSLRTYQRWKHKGIPRGRRLFIKLVVKDLRFKAA